MTKTTVKIDGMMCGMCEAHMNDAIRKAFPDAKKVKSSHVKGESTFLTETAPQEELIKKTIEETGYTFVSASTEENVKRGLFGW